MDFYLDENLTKFIADALHCLEQKDKINRVFSTEMSLGKGIKDCPLIKKLKEVNGIWITHDLKLMTRLNEFLLLKDEGVTVFIISLPSGCNFVLQYRLVIDRWEEIKKICRKHKQPFVCRLLIRGKEPIFY